MGRRRKALGRGLPANLYADNKNTKVYYRYRDPATGKFRSMGSDKAKAIHAARILNLHIGLAPEAHGTMMAAKSAAATFSAYAVKFFKEMLPTRRSGRNRSPSQSTISQYTSMLKKAEVTLGPIPISEVTRKHIADFLNGFPPTASNRYRSILRLLFRYAESDGLVDVNPVDKIMRKPEVVKRQRLTLQDYQAIHSCAEPWLQNAMDLGLQTLQRRGDLIRMRFDHIDGEYVCVRQQKTGKQIRIRIEIPLSEIVSSCRRDAIASPYLIHRRPKKIRREHAASKEHWTAVTPDMLSRAFQRARDRADLFRDLPAEQRPSFHEIRSLGAHLYREVGIDPQPLLGHLTPQMTQTYLEGHDHWSECIAGISIPR